MQKLLHLLMITGLVISCVAVDKEAQITLVRQGIPSISNITALNSPCGVGDVCSFQLSGTNLGAVDNATIDAGSGAQSLNIVAQNDGVILAETTLPALSIPINSLVDFAVSNARGMASVPVIFTIPASSITLTELDIDSIASQFTPGVSNSLLGNENPVFIGTMTGQNLEITGSVNYNGQVTYQNNAFFSFEDSGGTEIIEMRPSLNPGMSIMNDASLYVEDNGRIEVGGNLASATIPRIILDGANGNIQTSGSISVTGTGTVNFAGNTNLDDVTLSGLLQTTGSGVLQVQAGGTLDLANGSFIASPGTTIDLDTTANIEALVIDGPGPNSLDVTNGAANFLLGANVSGAPLNVTGPGNGISINDGDLEVLNSAGAGGDLTVAGLTELQNTTTITNGNLEVNNGDATFNRGGNSRVATDGTFEVAPAGVSSVIIGFDNISMEQGVVRVDDGSGLIATGTAGQIIARRDIISEQGDIFSQNGNVISDNGDVVSVNGNITATNGSVITGNPTGPFAAGVIHSENGVIAEGGSIEVQGGYIYSSTVAGAPVNNESGSITAEGNLYSDNGGLFLATTPGGAAGEIQGQFINLPNGAGTGNDSIIVGAGNINVQNGDVNIVGTTGSVPGTGNGDLNVAGEIAVGGAMIVGDASINLSGVFSGPIAPSGVRSFSVLDIGSTAVAAEVSVVLFGGQEVVAAKYFCAFDLAGIDAPDLFDARCEELSDVGSSAAPDPVNLSATLSGAPPTTGITFTVANGTGASVNGSVNVQITRAQPNALRPTMSGL